MVYFEAVEIPQNINGSKWIHLIFSRIDFLLKLNYFKGSEMEIPKMKK